MITTQRNSRLAILCVICTLSCVALLWVTTFVDGVALATTYSPEVHTVSDVHTDRDWQIAQIDDVFTNTALVEDSVPHAPIATDTRQSDSFSFEGVEYLGGVALLSHQVHPLHSGRNWQISHV